MGGRDPAAGPVQHRWVSELGARYGARAIVREPVPLVELVRSLTKLRATGSWRWTRTTAAPSGWLMSCGAWRVGRISTRSSSHG
jgi:hypothetical protein